MAMELCRAFQSFHFSQLTVLSLAMHKAWPALLKRMNASQIDLAADRELVVASRIWFCLYLFEHQYVIFSYFLHLYLHSKIVLRDWTPGCAKG